MRAAKQGRSAEAEMRAILEDAVKNKQRFKLGSMLAEIGRQVRLSDEEFAIMSQVRGKTPAMPVNFE